MPRFEHLLDPQPRGQRYNVALHPIFADTDRSLAFIAILVPHGAALPQKTHEQEMSNIAGTSERALRHFAMYRSVVRNREAMPVETAQTCEVSTLLHLLT
jgi:hypothetical protein